MQVRVVEGVRLHHAVTGEAEGLPVVFANSLGTDLRVWDALLPLLPRGLKIVRYDMRGHGLSDAPEGDYWMGDLVGEAAGLMDALGVKDAVFVGLSIGGVVAQGLAAERPDLVRAHGAVQHRRQDRNRGQLARADRRGPAGGIGAIADGVLEKWFTRGFRDERADELALWRHMLTRTPRGRLLRLLRGARRYGHARSRTRRCGCRFWPSSGRTTARRRRTWCRETAETIDGARFEIIRARDIFRASSNRRRWRRYRRTS